ncbi:hypothetical protein ACTFIW_009588 [Dictyostelium discoideum]
MNIKFNLIIIILLILFISNVNCKKIKNKKHLTPQRLRRFVEHSKPISLNKKVWKITEIENIFSAQIELTFGIRQRNVIELEDFVWRVSDPNDSLYGSYKTFEEIKEWVKPLDESIDAVKNWLIENDINEFTVTKSGDFIRTTVSIDKAEELLSVRYNKMVHKSSKQSFFRSLDPYTIPRELYDHIDFIGGVNHLPLLSPRPKESSGSVGGKVNGIGYELESLKNNKQIKSFNDKKVAARNGDPYLSPDLIRKEMNVSQTSTNSTHLGNSQAIAQFLKEYFSPSDLKNFQYRFGMEPSQVDNIIGPNQNLNPGLETTLDIQYIMAMAPDVPTWIVSTGGLHEGQEPFLDWLVDLSSNPKLPLVHSISYGDDESSIGLAYTDRVDTEFKKYAAMGRTIVFSSGDFGVGCNDDCDSFSPGWPASSRFVLAVGGVIKKKDGSIIGDEISGGGFSNYFSRPWYQVDECSSYIEWLNGSLSSFYNQSGRGFPDISSFSENVIILYKDKLMPIGGTSASAPIIAGLLSLINDQRLQKNQSPIGLFNPLLYKIARDHPNSFLDIDFGENNYKCCTNGFKSKSGWDPVTGLGLPNFDELVKNCLE